MRDIQGSFLIFKIPPNGSEKSFLFSKVVSLKSNSIY